MSSKESSLSFHCPRCDTMITVSTEIRGKNTACPNCGANLIVPGSSPTADDGFNDLFELEPESDVPISLASPSAESLNSAATPTEPDVVGEAPVIEISEDEILADHDFPDLAPVEAPLESKPDPFAPDESAPIRLDDALPIDGATKQIRVTCPVCDSVMFTRSEFIGRQIQCSDCFTMIDVHEPKEPVKPGPKALDQSAGRPRAEELSAFPEIPEEISPAASELGGEYGLEPPAEDLLKPREHALPEELLEVIGKIPATPDSRSSQPANPVSAPVIRVETPAPATPTSVPATPAVKAAPSKAAAGENLLPAVEAPAPPLQRESVSEMFRWPDKFLAPFRDVSVLQLAVMVAVLLALGYATADAGLWLMNYVENKGNNYKVFGGAVILLGGGIHFFAMFLSAVLVNQLVEGAAYKRSVFHPPEFEVAALVYSFLTVGVSFWAGMLPGVVLGQLFNAVFARWWTSLVVAFGTAFLLAPIGILGAYYNGSPFMIVSSDVIRSVREHTDGWLRFYLWMALWVFLFCLSWVFLLIPVSLIASTICAIAQSICLVLMGRTIGLLAQAFINFWVHDEGA